MVPRSLTRLASCLALLGTPVCPAQQAGADPVWQPSDDELAPLVELYRDLHAHPELSFHEQRTAEQLATALERAGVVVTRGVGGTGIVGVLANGDGPVGLLRADMDALPIAEATGLPFASKVRAKAAGGAEIGVMHACGHDVHMANLVGAARWFATHRTQWRGTLLFIGQPAEERVGGAKAMLAAGLFDRFPRPAWALALHCDPMLPAGVLGVRAGALMAAVDSVDVTLFGKGGHGAAPHRTIDPIVLAAQYVLALQTIVSREVDPVEAVVITVGAIAAGSKHNIVPDRCELQLTVRSYDEQVRRQMHAAIVRKAKALADAAGAPAPTVEFSEPSDALHNDAALTQRITGALRAALGPDQVVEIRPQMVAEDFGQFGSTGVPICMLRVGTTAPDRLQRELATGGPPALHSPAFWPDLEPTLRGSLAATVAAVRDLLADR